MLLLQIYLSLRSLFTVTPQNTSWSRPTRYLQIFNAKGQGYAPKFGDQVNFGKLHQWNLGEPKRKTQEIVKEKQKHRPGRWRPEFALRTQLYPQIWNHEMSKQNPNQISHRKQRNNQTIINCDNWPRQWPNQLHSALVYWSTACAVIDGKQPRRHTCTGCCQRGAKETLAEFGGYWHLECGKDR